MLTLAHPQYFLPVHGEFKQLKRHAETAEHSAILQCIVGEASPIRKILLTASGGPFRTFSKRPATPM